ncbi:NUDIX hydrolase [Nesterenkonia jeotgali]|uniref:ADP-ribose pyrophosphatase YjhB (NUDIX family) n=1 Tax=Nesterenkonia jeotgali TaxID=317018 RepID=A0A839G1J1_9MICC|nr:NUDIX domain-containing protein [Nesterenkonia jeotgali]MBA8922797.1 ADP-ribose pyrophosphatase YjhB (NUDIX family) [Nesterenkonia jeotgali]
MELRVAAYAVITDQDGRMLLPHWHVSGTAKGWTLPGGGLDPGEDPADGVVREVFEESGYQAEVQELLGIDNFIIPGERRIHPSERGTPLQNLRIIYRARVTGGSLTVEPEGSTDDVRWFSHPEIDALHRVSLVDVGRRFAGLLTDAAR